MKIFLFFILIGFTVNAQELTVNGVAIDSTKGKHKIKVAVNDTIRKFKKEEYDCFHPETWNRINDQYTTMTEFETGQFSIKADISDSLTFYSSSSFNRYISQTHAVKDLIKMDKIYIELEPEECIEYVKCKEEPEVYAFVGKVLEVKKVEEIYYCDYLTLDLKYKATLKIQHQVFNNYKSDTITFFAYDHYSKPAFSEFENVLIYISEACDVNYHAKYLFSPAYQVGDSWKVTYATPQTKVGEMLHELAKPIKFDDDLYYEFGNNLTEKELGERFPEPYFYRKGSFVRPLYGYDVKDVFDIMKKTRLKKYGFFQDE
jgi:hypothetical protein